MADFLAIPPKFLVLSTYAAFAPTKCEIFFLEGVHRVFLLSSIARESNVVGNRG